VYDMYPWTESADARPPAPADVALTSAVQFALDRRDNGGDAASVPAPGAGRQ
jgi:hypothetical protein